MKYRTPSFIAGYYILSIYYNVPHTCLIYPFCYFHLGRNHADTSAWTRIHCFCFWHCSSFRFLPFLLDSPSLCLLTSKVWSKEKPASRFAALEAETNAAISMYRVGKKGRPEKSGQSIRRTERNKE